jgi:hypothetical protein
MTFVVLTITGTPLAIKDTADEAIEFLKSIETPADNFTVEIRNGGVRGNLMRSVTGHKFLKANGDWKNAEFGVPDMTYIP